MTRFRPPLAILLLSVPLAMPAAAGAAVPHTVERGETLWTIAVQSNLTTRTLAAFNGLPEDGHVILGSTIQIPSEAEGAAALAGLSASPGTASAAAGGDGHTHPETGSAAAGGDAHTHAPAETHTHGAAPAPMGSYIVRPGDTLAKLAAVAGVSVDAIAGMNGLDPARYLLSGTVLKLPSGSPTPPAAEEQPAPAATVVPPAAPNPTPGRVTANDIAQIASAHGVPGSLASAIAWQESGFNNSMVSSANARGVMQVMPGTWSWVQENLSDRPLNPDSPTDNVHAGVLYLRQLLDETGGDEDTAIAGYYQGLGSVRSRGFYDDTKRYVENVQALRSRFGG